jgi:hypothetical protein
MRGEKAMKRRFVLCILTLVAGVGFTGAAWAQAVGQILGTVSDPSGAVIPGSNVTAVQNGTSLTRTVQASSAGTYFIPALPVGTYKVTAEAAGFKSGTTEVTLDVNQQREVDFTLALAGTTTTVEVSAAPPLLTTTNATIGGLVTGQQLTTLPLNGRSITGLVYLQPGVTQEINTFQYGNVYWAGNGNRGFTNTSSLDGSDTGDKQGGGAQFTNFNLDAIAEFKVLQNNYSAEYGGGGGTIVQLVTKSGTNEVHGSFFEYLRNDALDSRNFFSTDVPPFKRNEFGGTFGGPVYLPRVYNGKDRTFFFAQYAGLRQRRGSPVLARVPTAEERQGILNITDENGNPDQLLVPLNPVAEYVMSQYPLPNNPSGPFGDRTFNLLSSLPENHDQFSVRGDHRFSSKDTIFIRASYLNQHLPYTNAFARLENPSFSSHLTNDQRNHSISETHVFSGTLLNTFRFGVSPTYMVNAPGTIEIPRTQFSGGGYSAWGPASFIAIYKMYNFSFHDSLAWTKGRHTMNFGGEFRRVWDNALGASSGAPSGTFTFRRGTPLPIDIPSASGENDIPAGTASPDPILSFMTGAPGSYTRAMPFPGFGPPGGGFAPFGVRRYHLYGWFQDDFKVNRALTLNLGLRYEYNSVPHEVANRFTGIVDDPNLEGGAVYRRLVLNPTPLWHPDHRGYGPRFGFAYKLDDKTVIRGGYGIFTNVPPTTYPDQAGFGFPYASFSSRTNPPYSRTPLSVAGGPQPVLTDLSGNPLPPGGDTHRVPPNTPVDLVPVAQYYGGPLIINLTSLSFRNGYTMSGNFTLERALPGDMVWQIGYVTNNAAKLYGSEWPNGYTDAPASAAPYTAANPGLGQFQLTDNHSHSTYHALQTMFRKTSPSHGLQFQVSYTWSKAIDDSSTVYNAANAAGGTLQNDPTCWRCEKSTSGFDFPHTLVMNFVYRLPFDHFQSLPRRLSEGWQITSIARAQSGYPFTVGSPFGTWQFGTDTYIQGYATGTRPDLIQQPTLKSGGGPEEQFFSDDVINDGVNLGGKYFATPGAVATGLQDHPGNLGRNTFRGNSFSNVDFSLIKDTKLTERFTLQFRSEFFNLFNQHAFQAPNAVLGDPSFGISTSTIYAERQIQFGLRLLF